MTEPRQKPDTGAAPSSGSGISKDPILRHSFDEYNVYEKNDGKNYLSLLRAYLESAIPVRELGSQNPETRVSLVDWEGKQYIIKRDGIPIVSFERKAWRILTGPFYSYIMKRVNRAIRGGCRVAVDIFLVAEKIRHKLAQDSYIIMEYANGTPIGALDDLEPYHGKLVDAFIDLHKHGLSLGDPSAYNIVLTPSGTFKMFDYSSKGTQFSGRAKDRIKCKKFYNINIPNTFPLDPIANANVLLQLRKTAFFRKLRGKPYIEY